MEYSDRKPEEVSLQCVTGGLDQVDFEDGGMYAVAAFQEFKIHARGGVESRVALTLEGLSRPLVLGPGAIKTLSRTLGEDLAKWVGRTVELFARKADRIDLRPIAAAKSPIEATPYEWMDPASIEPRDWLYGRHLIRKFISCTVAASGVGKSSLCVAEVLSMVTGRGLLIDRAPRRGKVWWWNGEDPRDELGRRMQAACLHYGIGRQDIEGRLFVDSGREKPIVIAHQTKEGATINAPDVDAVKATISKNGIDLLIIDPFVASHRVAENDTMMIETVAWEWAKIADECKCAIELVHHTRKTGGAAATVEDARGAIALIAKARSARVLNTMTAEEAQSAGVDNPRIYFRVENGKASMAPPAAAADWYRIESVGLGNATNERPQDLVGVVTRWTWPQIPEATDQDLAQACAALQGQMLRASPQAGEWAGYPILEALGLSADDRAHKARVRKLIATALKAGLLELIEAEDAQRHMRKFVRAPRPLTEQQASVASPP